MVCILLSQFGQAPHYLFLPSSFGHSISLGVCKSQCPPVWMLHSEGESSNSSLAAAENPLLLENVILVCQHVGQKITEKLMYTKVQALCFAVLFMAL